MARTKRNDGQRNVADPISPASTIVQPTDAKFVNVSFNDEDKQWLHAQLDDLFQHVDALLVDAEKHTARISVLPDIKSGRWNATFTPYHKESSHYGFILSARGATPLMALYCLAYAHFYKPDAWAQKSNNPADMFG